MNKKLIILFAVICLLVVPQVSAFFTISHEYWVLQGFEDVDSPITRMCADRIDIVLDGQHSADIPVIHYFDEQFMSYISTHTRGSGYQACLERAGTDPDLLCFCYGMGLHNVEDHFAHTEDGVVPKYLSKYFSSNLLGHMIIELDFEGKHMELVKNSNVVTNGQLDYYDSIMLDNLFEEVGGDQKYLNLLQEMTGLDMRNDANIFANGYKGQGFYDTVYNQKLNLPWWFWGISIGFMIFGVGMAIVFIIFGNTTWKYSLIFIYLMIALIGLLILLSLYTNNSWEWVRMAISMVPISVADSDITFYNDAVQRATNQFLQTGNLLYDDNSGLSYVDRDGIKVSGALGEAEKSFQYIILPIAILLFALLNMFLMYKTFKGGGKKRKKK